MKEYVVFRLYGPMASWGQAAVGGDRPTGIQPTRSALLGLLGAALGVKRNEEEALSDLSQSVCFGVKQCAPSSLMRDYHTSQVPSNNKKVVHRSRRSELNETKLNTILSSRDYRCDGLWVVAVWLAEKPTITLEQLRQALIKPVFSLCLGRKSCPPSLPLAPRVVQTALLKEVLDTEFPPITRSHKEDSLWLGFNGRATYFWEGDKDELPSSGVLTTEPWDQPIHRERWQFKQREMHQLSVVEGANVFI